jgi:hypothetical protein
MTGSRGLGRQEDQKEEGHLIYRTDCWNYKHEGNENASIFVRF